MKGGGGGRGTRGRIWLPGRPSAWEKSERGKGGTQQNGEGGGCQIKKMEAMSLEVVMVGGGMDGWSVRGDAKRRGATA